MADAQLMYSNLDLH